MQPAEEHPVALLLAQANVFRFAADHAFHIYLKYTSKTAYK